MNLDKRQNEFRWKEKNWKGGLQSAVELVIIFVRLNILCTPG